MQTWITLSEYLPRKHCFRLLKVWIFRFQWVNNMWILSWFPCFSLTAWCLENRPVAGNRQGYLLQLWEEFLLMGGWPAAAVVDSGTPSTVLRFRKRMDVPPAKLTSFLPSSAAQPWSPASVLLVSTTAQAGFSRELPGVWAPGLTPAPGVLSTCHSLSRTNLQSRGGLGYW